MEVLSSDIRICMFVRSAELLCEEKLRHPCDFIMINFVRLKKYVSFCKSSRAVPEFDGMKSYCKKKGLVSNEHSLKHLKGMVERH